MRNLARVLVIITAAVLVRSGAPLVEGGPVTPCPTAGAAPPPITMGHFEENAPDVARLCRYLVSNRILPQFVNLGSVRAPDTPSRVGEALEAGTIDVVWLNASAIAILLSNPALQAKVLGVTDLPVLHIMSNDRAVNLVTDSGFVRASLMVAEGESAFYADMLDAAIGRAARCGPAVGCQVQPGQTGFAGFLTQPQSNAVVIASPIFPLPSGVVRGVLQSVAATRLISIPPGTVAKMEGLPGITTMVTLLIARNFYAGGGRTDLPGVDLPTAAGPVAFISGTPAAVVERVREFVIRLNEALLQREPRLPRQHLELSLRLMQTMSERVGGRLVLHEEYARALERIGIRVGPAAPTPTTTTPAFPTPPPTRRPPTEPPVTVPPTQPSAPRPEIREFTASTTVTGRAPVTTLCWVVINAVRARIDPEVGSLEPQEIARGCRRVSPRETTTYRLTAFGQDPRIFDIRQVRVVVQPIRTPTPTPRPTPTPTPTPPVIR